jgi:chromosomal replication initiation ATPase DnaA
MQKPHNFHINKSLMPLQMQQQKTLHDVVIEAVALYFRTTAEDLKTLKSKKRADAYKKHMCIYMIRKNDSMLSREFIAELFNTGKSTIAYGENCIENYSGIYGRTMGDITEIQKIIDNFNDQLKQQMLQTSVWHTHNSNTTL